MKNILVLFLNFIKLKVYITSLKAIPSCFGPAIRHALLIIDKFPVEYPLLMLLLHLPLKCLDYTGVFSYF